MTAVETRTPPPASDAPSSGRAPLGRVLLARPEIGAAVAAIDENIATLGLRDRTTVRVGDAITAAPRIDADLAFADPPYEFDEWPRLLRAITAQLVVAEAAAIVDAPVDWEQGRTKRYGRTWVTFLRRELP